MALQSVLASPVAVAGCLCLLLLYLATHQDTVAAFRASGATDKETIPFVLVAFFVQMLVVPPLLTSLHPLIQGLAARSFGARPAYGVELSYRVLPTPYCTAAECKFTRLQYVAVTASPAFFLSLAGASCVALAPYGGWLVLPLGFYLGGAWVSTIWYLFIVLRQPHGVLFEDLRGSIRFHRTPR